MIFLGLLYICISWEKTQLHLVLYMTHRSGECIVKVLFIILVFYGRYRFFSAYRNKTYLIMGFFGFSLMKCAFYFYHGLSVKDWYSSVLNIAEFAILSVFYGIIIEFTFVVLDQVFRSKKPFNYELSLISNGFRAGEKVLRLMTNITVFYTFLIILGLYTLNTVYLFNWFFYCRIGALLLLISVLLTLGTFEKRIQKENAYLLWKIDKGLDSVLNSIDFGDHHLNSEENILSLIALRKHLAEAGKLPWNWRRIALIGGCIVFLLSQPYLYQMIFI